MTAVFTHRCPARGTLMANAEGCAIRRKKSVGKSPGDFGVDMRCAECAGPEALPEPRPVEVATAWIAPPRKEKTVSQETNKPVVPPACKADGCDRPQVTDRNGKSRGYCREHMIERQAAGRKKSQKKAGRLAKAAGKHEAAPAAMVLCRILEQKVRAAKACLVACSEVDPSQAAQATVCVHVSAAVLVSAVENLAAVGGIPGWGKNEGGEA